MRYYSTRNASHKVDLKQAVFNGLAPDGGLYLPEKIQSLPAFFFEQIAETPFDEINYMVGRALTGDSLPEDELRKIASEAVNFPTPVVEIEPGVHCLELFHGPTLAFKDVGARFMALLLSYFAQKSGDSIKVVVATSGDTGGAVAAGFFNVEGVEVHILYPKGRVSPLQEKQLTTWGGNIKAIEVEGSFDDCQALAKKLLSDEALRQKMQLTSANSINIARLIPQSFYYFHLYAQLKKEDKDLIVAVPSGNFGNLTGGLLAKLLGLPIRRFIAATNANDIVPKFLGGGAYVPMASVATLSNAMDVGAPSNFERMKDLLGTEASHFLKWMEGSSWSDEDTTAAMHYVKNTHAYTLDPHGAVGYLGIVEALKKYPGTIGVFLETAHPAKFADVVRAAIGSEPEMPERLTAFAKKTKVADTVPNDYEEVRRLIAG